MAGNDNDNRIWWDLENCGVPRELDAGLVLDKIEEKLKEEGYTGAVTAITVFVRNEESVPSWVRERLGDRIEIVYLDNEEKEAADNAIKLDIELWLRGNPPPQNAMIITGDNGFSATFGALQDAGHHTMIAFRPNQPQAVISTKMHRVVDAAWYWRIFLGLEEEAKPGEVARMKLEEGQFAQLVKRWIKGEKERLNKKKRKRNRPPKKVRKKMKRRRLLEEAAAAAAAEEEESEGEEAPAAEEGEESEGEEKSESEGEGEESEGEEKSESEGEGEESEGEEKSESEGEEEESEEGEESEGEEKSAASEEEDRGVYRKKGRGRRTREKK